MRNNSLLLSAAVFGLVLPSSMAQAQEAAASTDSEIIVSARKRQESVLQVPVVVTALGAAQLERSQVKDIVDIAKQTTGLQLGVAPVETGTLITMRGYGTTALDPGIDQSVSLNLDGMQLTQGMAYSVGFFDMQQVEVLKGPQALFFGKASPAGVVSIRTKDPGDELEIVGKTGYEFVAREWRSELVLSGPVTDTLGIRLAGLYGDYGGFFKNTATPGVGALPMPKRLGETKTVFLRGTALFRPNSNFSARLKVNYTRDKQYGAQAAQLVACPDGTRNFLALDLGLPIPSFFSANEDCKKDRTLNIVGMDPAAFTGMRDLVDGGRPASFVTQRFGTLELNYNPSSDISLTSLTGYYKLKAHVAFNCHASGGTGPGCMTGKRLQRKEFTQELRAVSDFSGPLNFSVGAFYQNGQIFDDEFAAANTLLGLPPVIFDGTQDVDIKAFSLFGQLRYNLTEHLELAGGVRWTDEKRSNDPTSLDVFGTGTGVPGTRMVAEVAQPDIGSKTWSPEFTISYKPTSDLTLFASLKQAYKSGSYNIFNAIQPGERRAFGDEKIRGAEIGLKSRLLDRQLNFNLAGYYYKLSGLQVGTVLPAAGLVPLVVTVNAGSAKIYGLEADFSYRPADLDGFELFGAINYNHARFTNFVGAPCVGGQSFAEGCNLQPAQIAPDGFPAFTDPALFGGAPFRYTASDLSGTRLPNAPDWTANIGFNYEMPVGGDMKLGFGGDARFTSKYVGGLDYSDNLFQKAIAKLNARVSLKGKDDGWEVTFIGNNLTNRIAIGSAGGSNTAGGVFFPGMISGGPADGPAGNEEIFGYLERGRELWIRLTLRPAALFGR